MDLIAIDGLAGTGKSTLAKALAIRLGLNHLDTGASFRMMAWAALNSGVNLDIESEVLKATKDILITYESGRSSVNNKDVTMEIRDERVSAAASRIAIHPGLRMRLLQWQRKWVSDHGASVVEGRDTTSVIFPDAAVKVYLEADPLIRASRRVESSANGIAERDMRDLSRTAAPLKRVADAVVIDTSTLPVSDIEDIVVALWEKRKA
ncbi:MAG: (d)CMP kinase [Acidimicrobiaceae bacterium]|nr:(d)CMP kinase [Acidimicrobiaceae bacterium]